MRYLYLLVYAVVSFLILCCSNNTGNLDFEQEQESEFTKRIPEIGTFNFKQKYFLSVEKNKITTLLKVTSTSQITDSIDLEILAFRNKKFSFKNIAFIYHGSLNLNDDEFKMVDSEGSVLLKDELVLVNLFNINNPLSGNYNGIGKVISKKDNGNDYDVNEIFNLNASIDIYNRLYIFPLESSSSFDYLNGIYTDIGEFSGQIFKDSISIGSIKNLESKPFVFEDNTNLNDTLSLSANNTERKLVISLQKAN